MTQPSKDLQSFEKKIIVIIGHMGSGKSTIGKILARNLNWNYFDSDKEIERRQKNSIKNIFQTHGENFFRKEEEVVIKNLINITYSVISLGGGSITIKNIRKILKKKAISIFLKVDIDVLIERLSNTKKRPLLINTDIKNKIVSLDAERSKFYNKADIIIKNSDNLNIVTSKIMRILNK